MADAKLFLITGFSGGLSVGVQADTVAEFNQLVLELQQNPLLHSLFAPALGQAGPAQTIEQATSVVTNAFPQATQVSTVGQPLPQPGVVAQPAAQPAVAAAPPTVPYPGNCAHGVRIYKDTPARGAQWRRWECAVEWKKGDKAWNDQRCAAVNA